MCDSSNTDFFSIDLPISTNISFLPTFSNPSGENHKKIVPKREETERAIYFKEISFRVA